MESLKTQPIKQRVLPDVLLLGWMDKLVKCPFSETCCTSEFGEDGCSNLRQSILRKGHCLNAGRTFGSKDARVEAQEDTTLEVKN